MVDPWLCNWKQKPMQILCGYTKTHSSGSNHPTVIVIFQSENVLVKVCLHQA